MSAYLKDYIDNLRQNAVTQSTPKELPEQQVSAYKPLTEQITKLMQSLPNALKNKPWSMQELVSRLDGKYRDRPHAQLVGIALRQLGWSRKRLWNTEYQGVRLWIPPTQR